MTDDKERIDSAATTGTGTVVFVVEARTVVVEGDAAA